MPWRLHMYSYSTVQGTLSSFAGCFEEGTVIWRPTSRPNDKLSYRFYLRRRLDTVALAVEACLGLRMVLWYLVIPWYLVVWYGLVSPTT